MTRMKIGLCAVCEGEVLVRADDTTRKHGGPVGGDCHGSYRRAAAILALTFRRWLTRQTNRRGHGRDLYIGRLARYVVRFGDEWVSADDLAEAMGRAGVHPDAAIVRYLAEAAAEFDALSEASSSAGDVA